MSDSDYLAPDERDGWPSDPLMRSHAVADAVMRELAEALRLTQQAEDAEDQASTERELIDASYLHAPAYHARHAALAKYDRLTGGNDE